MGFCSYLQLSSKDCNNGGGGYSVCCISVFSHRLHLATVVSKLCYRIHPYLCNSVAYFKYFRDARQRLVCM